MLSYDYIEFTLFWPEYHRSMGALLSASYLEVHDIYGIGDINFDHLVKGVSAWFLHPKVTVFPFVTNKNLVERYLETMQISYLSLCICPLIFASLLFLKHYEFTLISLIPT